MIKIGDPFYDKGYFDRRSTEVAALTGVLKSVRYAVCFNDIAE
jgi:hypothetical protein